MEEDNNNKNPKILIVADNERPGKTLSDILKAKGYSPVAVLTGKGGIAIAKEEDIPLVLLDLKLPDISGIEVLKEIKKNSPRTGSHHPDCFCFARHRYGSRKPGSIQLSAEAL